MPYTPTTPTLTLCDDLVDAINAAWTPSDPDAVERRYLERIDLDGLRGRRVFFFPAGYDNRPATRGHDDYTHRITCLVVEKYPDAGDPPREWIDERVDFVHTQVVQGLDFSRAPPSFNRQVLTLSADVPAVYDAEMLTTKKQFWCAVELVFVEFRSA